MKHVTGKLGTMKKAVEWTVYPKGRDNTDNLIIVQSDHRIAQFDPATGRGVLSKHASHPGFIMLAKVLGATPILVPPDFIAAALDAQPKPGDAIGPGVFVG